MSATRHALALALLGGLYLLSACSLLAGGALERDESGAGSAVPQLDAPLVEEQRDPSGFTALSPGDVFEVRVFEEDALSGVYRVGTDGFIDYPLCGRVRIGGLNASEASAAIAECLREGYLRHPQVSVFVKEHNSRQVFVFGQVSRPGSFPYRDGMTVVEAITRAEGFTKVAARNAVVITRVVDGSEQRLRIPVEDIGVGRAPNFALEPGDIIFVPESFF